MKIRPRHPPARPSRFAVLTRHFFRRMFVNETVSFEDRMAAKIAGLIAVLAIMPGVMADSLLFKYLLAPDRGTFWADATMFIAVVMLMIGIITLFERDGLFLDQRDYRNLMPLPVRPFTVFSAKFASLVMFIGMFALGINSLSSFVFAMYLGHSRGYGLAAAGAVFMVHILVMLAASVFVFLLMALVAGGLAAVHPGRLFQRLSDAVRIALMAGQLYLIYLFLVDTRFIRLTYDQVRALKTAPSAFMMNFPPLWFSGLYQTMLGDRDPFFRGLAARALLALAAVIAAFILVTLLAYRRSLAHMASEGRERGRRSPAGRLLEPILNSLVFRSPAERAFFLFNGRTLSRSRFHRTRILSCLGVGSGLAVIMFASVGSYFRKDAAGAMLSLPLVLSFFLLVGLRDACDHPLEFEANWVLRTAAGHNAGACFSSLKKTVFLFILLPLHALLLAFYRLFWSWRTAGIHSLYALALAVLLMEVLFFRRRKIPFACSYLPGRAGTPYFWLIYALLGVAYVFVPRRLEPYFLTGGAPFVIFMAAVAAVVAAVHMYHGRFFYPKHPVVFDDEPEPVMTGIFQDI